MGGGCNGTLDVLGTPLTVGSLASCASTFEGFSLNKISGGIFVNLCPRSPFYPFSKQAVYTTVPVGKWDQ